MILEDKRPLSTAELMREQQREPAGQDYRPEDEQRPAALFSGDECDELKHRWNDIQTRFVDDPKQSVTQADELVATTIRRLTEVFADERNRLETEWGHSDRVSTEDLRLAFRRYRSFFDRLLSI